MNLEQLRSMKPQILAIAHEYGAGNVRVFGSVARGEAGSESDVDFLVTLQRPVGWEFFAIEPALEELLGCDVDVISDDAINRFMRDRIIAEAMPL